MNSEDYTLMGEPCGMRRVNDSNTIQIAVAGEIVEVLDKNIQWQILESTAGVSDDDPFKNIMSKNKIGAGVLRAGSAVDNKRTIIFFGSRENIQKALKIIGYNL